MIRELFSRMKAAQGRHGHPHVSCDAAELVLHTTEKLLRLCLAMARIKTHDLHILGLGPLAAITGMTSSSSTGSSRNVLSAKRAILTDRVRGAVSRP